MTTVIRSCRNMERSRRSLRRRATPLTSGRPLGSAIIGYQRNNSNANLSEPGGGSGGGVCGRRRGGRAGEGCVCVGVWVWVWLCVGWWGGRGGGVRGGGPERGSVCVGGGRRRGEERWREGRWREGNFGGVGLVLVMEGGGWWWFTPDAPRRQKREREMADGRWQTLLRVRVMLTERVPNKNQASRIQQTEYGTPQFHAKGPRHRQSQHHITDQEMHSPARGMRPHIARAVEHHRFRRR